MFAISAHFSGHVLFEFVNTKCTSNKESLENKIKGKLDWILPLKRWLNHEPIKGSLYLPYLALESTLSLVDLFIERLPQFYEPIKTELWQSLFYPHAHDKTGDSEERLDDTSDGSSDMVDVSSSENSASSDSESEEENLASQKTSCDGGGRRKLLVKWISVVGHKNASFEIQEKKGGPRPPRPLP